MRRGGLPYALLGYVTDYANGVGAEPTPVSGAHPPDGKEHSGIPRDARARDRHLSRAPQSSPPAHRSAGLSRRRADARRDPAGARRGGRDPQVLGAMPDGYRAIVVDNGSSDDSGAIAARHGCDRRTGTQARVRRGLSTPGCSLRDGGDRLHHGLRRIFDPPSCSGWWRRSNVARATSCSAAPAAPPALGRCTRGSQTGPRRGCCAHAAASRCAISVRCAPRAGVTARSHVEDRAFGYPLEMVLLARRAGWQIVELPVAYRPRTGRSKVTGTVRGTARAVRDMTLVLARVAHAEPTSEPLLGNPLLVGLATPPAPEVST